MTYQGSSRDHQQLWACWKKPTALPEAGGILLSFLPPADEERLVGEFAGTLIRAREASTEVRAEARCWYLSLVARIGACPDETGRTLRQALASPGRSSRWWYHPVSFRDCESDRTFRHLIAIRTIQTVAARHGAKRLVLVGASWDVAAVLRSGFPVEEQGTQRRPPAWWPWVRGLAVRVRYAIRTLRHWAAVRRHAPRPGGPFAIVFSGFWDWSVRKDKRAEVADRYFMALPDELIRRDLGPVGWFAWFDPHYEPGKAGRSLAEVLAPLRNCEEVVLLQQLLSVGDLLKALGDFAPLGSFLHMRRWRDFRAVFHHDGLNLWPLFEHRLLHGFVNADLPHAALVALATERACRRYRPKVTLSFLEHFPYARAHYEGVRRADIGTLRLAVQHCSWCHEKTFFFLDPRLELAGEPDGCAIPQPDFVCAMGTFGQELFMECGYARDRVVLTGSPRYDHVGLADRARPGNVENGTLNGINVLLVSSLDVDTEIDMVEAVFEAARGLQRMNLLLRNHPFSRIEKHPRFERLMGKLKISEAPLEDDLKWAGLIIYTYSTVAEEAFLQGKPVWQWLPLDFNGSALAEVVSVPQFGSVPALRTALQGFSSNPGAFSPREQDRRLVLERLFYRDDARAVSRVAEAVRRFLCGSSSITQFVERSGIGSVSSVAEN